MYYDPVTKQWVTPVNEMNNSQTVPQNFNQPVNPQPSRPASMPVILYALGDEEARAAQLRPGTLAYIFNTQEPVAYIKEVDSMGRPTRFETYDLVRREEKPKQESPVIDTSAFVTTAQLTEAMTNVKDELTQSLSKEIEKALTDAFSAKVGKSSKSKGE